MPFQSIFALIPRARKKLTLRLFILLAALVVSFVSFVVVYWISTIVYQNTLINNTTTISNSVSRQVFDSLHLLMNEGWKRDKLNRFLSTYHDAQGGSLAIRITRGEQVERQYGKANGGEPTEEVDAVFSTGRFTTDRTGYVITRYYPMKATAECAGCHDGVAEGMVLGVVAIEQDLKPMIDAANRKFLILFGFLSPIPFFMAWLISSYINASIQNSTKTLHEKVRSVNSVQDLTTLEMDDMEPGFVELNDIFYELAHFVKKLKHVAVDKEMLKFEIQLLEKFVITSEVIRDWKEYVGNLLVEINKVIEAYTIFSIFRIDDEVYDIEVFWINTPTEEIKRRVEQVVINKIERYNIRLKDVAELKMNHNVADPSRKLRELDEQELELQTKSLILETPQIGGVVGIGVQTEIAKDAVKSLVIESILTTLLNIVGSIKAIYKYTRDLEFYATRDPLTNLYNQRVFWELLGYEIGRAERYGYKFGLLVIDLDNFKNINDTYGHILGDKYLMEFAARMHDVLRKGDIFGRYGGDEFVVILPEADEEQSYLVATRMKELAESLSIPAPDGSRAKATISIGFAVYPTHASDSRDLFLFADNMTYRAKSEGKNTVLIPTEDDVVQVFRDANEKTKIVLQTIEEKKVIPFFQPICNLSTGKVECHEVLSRIQTDKGMIVAADFIEIAERLGIVTKLDYILIEKVFEKMTEEKYEGLIFINLSPKSLIIGEFIATITTLTRRFGIDHSKVVFELTERQTVKNLALLEKFVNNLHFEGFKFAIDDFGSGYSSFHYIRRLPIDFVKIEGEFVRNIGQDAKDHAFVKTLSVLAHELGIRMVAEYIEDEDILQAVKAFDVEFGQGYYIGIPGPELMK